MARDDVQLQDVELPLQSSFYATETFRSSVREDRQIEYLTLLCECLYFSENESKNRTLNFSDAGYELLVDGTDFPVDFGPLEDGTPEIGDMIESLKEKVFLQGVKKILIRTNQDRGGIVFVTEKLIVKNEDIDLWTVILTSFSLYELRGSGPEKFHIIGYADDILVIQMYYGDGERWEDV